MLFFCLLYHLPPFIESFFDGLFITPAGWGIELLTPELIWQIRLGHNGILVVMGVFVIFTITEIFHQSGRGIADMEWHRQSTGFFDGRTGLTKCGLDAVAFGCGCQINRGLGKCQLAFRMPQKFEGFHGMH